MKPIIQAASEAMPAKAKEGAVTKANRLGRHGGGCVESTRLRTHVMRRQAIESYIEQLIALLDGLDGDENLEDAGDAEPSVGTVGLYVGNRLVYDLEHDEADGEPNLGWSEYESEHGCNPHPTASEFGHISASATFTGDGHHIGRKLLRDKVKDQRKLAKAMNATRVAPGYGRYV